MCRFVSARKIPFPGGCLIMEAVATHIVCLAEGGPGIDDLVELRRQG
jgi:hypothetical protein